MGFMYVFSTPFCFRPWRVWCCMLFSPLMTMSSQTLCTELAQTRNLKKSLNTSKTTLKNGVWPDWSVPWECIWTLYLVLMDRHGQSSARLGCGCIFFNAFIRRDLLKQFTTMELMRWTSLVEDYGKELRDGSPDSPTTDVFSYSEEGEKRWKDLKNRVVEHVSWHTFCHFPTGGLLWLGSGRFGTWAQLD